MESKVNKIKDSLRQILGRDPRSTVIKKLRRQIALPVKLEVGSGGSFQAGWIATDKETPNLLKERD